MVYSCGRKCSMCTIIIKNNNDNNKNNNDNNKNNNDNNNTYLHRIAFFSTSKR